MKKLQPPKKRRRKDEAESKAALESDSQLDEEEEPMSDIQPMRKIRLKEEKPLKKALLARTASQTAQNMAMTIFGCQKQYDRKTLQTVRSTNLEAQVDTVVELPQSFAIQLSMKNAGCFQLSSKQAADAKSSSSEDDEDSEDEDDDDSDKSVEPEKKDHKKDLNPQKEVGLDHHPRDLLSLLMYISDPTARQIWAKNLQAINRPLELVSPTGELMLWQLAGLSKSWRDAQKVQRYAELMSYPSSPIVACITLGDSYEMTDMLNNFIVSDDFAAPIEVFFADKKLNPRTSRKPKYSLGAIDAIWLTPKDSGDGKGLEFRELVIFMHLRGNAQNYPEHLEFLRTFASVLVVMFDDKNTLKASPLKKKQGSCEKLVLIALKDRDGARKQVKDAFEKDDIKVMQNAADKGFMSKLRENIFGQVEEVIKKNESQPVLKSLQDIRRSLPTQFNGFFSCDLDMTLLAETENAAQEFITEGLGDLDCLDQKMIVPISHRDNWGVYAKTVKELRRIKFSEDMAEDVTNRIAELQSTIKEARERQRSLISQSCIGTFMRLIKKFKAMSVERALFIDWVALKLNSISNRVLVPVRLRHAKIVDARDAIVENGATEEELKAVDKKVKAAEDEIVRKSIGLEHIIREMGQYFECCQMVGPDFLSYTSKEIQKFNKFSLKLGNMPNELPRIVAELMLQGVPLEGMDGDNSFIQVEFIKCVFEELQNLTGSKAKVTAMGILGTQSTGKSTFLNAMHNFNFAVAAARCTKGINLQLVAIDINFKKKFPACVADYLLVLDTEGLKAPLGMAREEADKHDNEMATTIIGCGELTMINVRDAIDPAINDVLAIMIPAAFDLQQDENGMFDPRVIFIHQNCETGKSDPNEVHKDALVELKNTLDEATKNTCISRNIEERTFGQHISPLIHEFVDPLFSAGGVGYSTHYVRRVQQLKAEYVGGLKQVSTRKLLSFLDTGRKINHLWDNILASDWSLGFGKLNDLVADIKFSNKYTQWIQSVNEDILGRVQKKLTQIGDVNPHNITDAQLSVFFDEQEAQILDHYRAQIDQYVKDMDTKAITERKRYYMGRLERRIAKALNQETSRVMHRLNFITGRAIANNKVADIKSALNDKVTNFLGSLSTAEKEALKGDTKHREREFEKFWKAQLQSYKAILPRPPKQVLFPETDAKDQIGIRYSDREGAGGVNWPLMMTRWGWLDQGQDFHQNLVRITIKPKYVRAFFEDNRNIAMKGKSAIAGFFKRGDTWNLNHEVLQTINSVKKSVDERVKTLNQSSVAYTKAELDKQMNEIDELVMTDSQRVERNSSGFRFSLGFRCAMSSMLLHYIVPQYDIKIKQNIVANDPAKLLDKQERSIKTLWDDICAGVDAAEIAAKAIVAAIIEVAGRNVSGAQASSALQATKALYQQEFVNKQAMLQTLMKNIMDLEKKGEGWSEASSFINSFESAAKTHLRNRIKETTSKRNYYQEYVKTKISNLKSDIVNWLSESSFTVSTSKYVLQGWFDNIVSDSKTKWDASLLSESFIGCGLQRITKRFVPSFRKAIHKQLDEQWKKFEADWEKDYAPKDSPIEEACKTLARTAVGCPKQCPFCSAPCDYNIDHSASHCQSKMHRCGGLSGTIKNGTELLMNDHPCPTAIKKNETINFYRDGGRVSKTYAEWLAFYETENPPKKWTIPKGAEHLNASEQGTAFLDWLLHSYSAQLLKYHNKKGWAYSTKSGQRANAEAFVAKYADNNA